MLKSQFRPCASFVWNERVLFHLLNKYLTRLTPWQTMVLVMVYHLVTQSKRKLSLHVKRFEADLTS